MICCAGSDSASHPATPPRPHIPGASNLFHPQITMRPPWAAWSTRPTTTTTTTTTTMRPLPPQPHWTTPAPPQTQRTTFSSLYPNWPPPFITHPPSHFPSWVHNTFGTQGTTTTPPTTQRPSHHWPPQQQYPTHKPPSIMTTPPSVTQAPVSSSCGFGKIVGGSQAAKGGEKSRFNLHREGSKFRKIRPIKFLI